MKMKKGLSIAGVQLAGTCMLLLSQGCVTSSETGADVYASPAATHKGPWRYGPKTAHSAPRAPAADFSAPAVSSEISGGGGLAGESVVAESALPPSSYVAPAASAEPTDVYVVRKGDVLSRIAVAYGTTTRRLQSLNALANPDRLYVGQRLKVPAGRHAAVRRTSGSRASSATKRGGTYVVKKGDTLSGIAHAAGVKLADLRAANHIKGDMIYAGQKIFLPAYGKVPSGARSPKRSVAAPKKTPSEPKPVSVASTPEEPALAPLATTEPAAEPAVEEASDLPPAMEEAASGTMDSLTIHLVYPGETLDDIAAEYSVSKEEIMDLNGIVDESEVKEGRRLRIPQYD